MKRHLLFKSLLLLCALVVGSGSVWADSTDSYTATSSDKPTAKNGTTSGSVTGTNSISWSYSVTQETKSGKSPYVAHTDASGWQLGSGNSPCKAFSISTSGISGTITKIEVVTGSKSASSKIYVTVGGGDFGTQGQSTGSGSSVATQTFTGSASGEIIVSASASSEAFYFKSVTVTYSSSYSVTYNSNGATSGTVPTDATAYLSGATVTVKGNTGSLAKTGYAFGGWNTKADGTGTDYDKDDTFTITASTTLYAKWNPYSITAVSSNNSYGSVSLDGFVITGSPESGYRYASPAYSVTSGSATVAQEGNAFTVTPTSDCTVRINFEAIPTHTITCVADPVGAGTFDAVSSLYEGATTDIKATANAGYKFTGWSVSGTGASLSSDSDNPTTLTMGSADATVTATFEAVTTYAISYSINGSIVKTVNIEENKAVDLSAPASGIPAGYFFKGWRTATLDETNTDPDDYVISAKSTADITYYAVMAVKTVSSPDTYEKLANNSFDANATYVIGGVQGGSGGDGSTMMYLSGYSAVDEDINWGTCTSAPATYAPVTFKLSGTAAALVAKDNSGNYLAKSTEVKKFAMSSTSTTVYLDTDGAIKTASDGWRMRYNHNNGSGGLRLYDGTTGQQAYFYKVIDNCTYSNYCTSLPATIELNPAKTYTTLTSKYPLDFTSSDLKAFIATEIADSKVQMTQVNKVPANTGLVLKATSTGSAINVPVLSGAADDVTDNKMAGSAFSTTAVAANAGYILSGGVFQPSSGGDLPAGKAYLNIAVGAGARALEMNFDEDVTAISATLNDKGEMTNDSYFNLAGQRVANPTKGLYIVNGRKVVVK